jgi:hypothetical protein
VHTAITRISLVSDPKLAGGRSIPDSGFPNIVGATDGISPVVTLATSINEGRSNSPSSDGACSCSDATLVPEDSAMTTLWNGLWSNKTSASVGAAAGSWWDPGTPQAAAFLGGQTQIAPKFGFDSFMSTLIFSSHIRAESLLSILR